MSDMLTDKIVLITGATSGIGEAMARGFAARGARIVFSGLGDADRIADLQSAFTSPAGGSVFIPADLSRGDEAEALVRSAEDQLGRVDIVINNAGVQHVDPIDHFPADKWELIIAVNLSACFYITKAVLPGMKTRGFGRVINIASAHGLVASPFKSAYVASKHGVIGLTKTTALEIAEAGNVTANAICPGYVRTPLVEGQIKDQAAAHGMTEDDVVAKVILAAQPNKRFVEPEELTALAALIASDKGRSFNGAALEMDGGWTAR